jgi:hypothetical protein
LKESFSIIKEKLILVTKLSIVNVDYKDFEGQRKQRNDREIISFEDLNGFSFIVGTNYRVKGL